MRPSNAPVLPLRNSSQALSLVEELLVYIKSPEFLLVMTTYPARTHIIDIIITTKSSVMSNTPTEKPDHTTPANPFGPLIATSFRYNGTTRQCHDYNPAAHTQNQDEFLIGATHATKRRNAQSEGIVEERKVAAEEGIATASGRSRSYDSLAECPASEDVEDTGDSGDDEGSEASSRTLGRSDASGFTLAADEDEGKETNEGEGDSDESMEDFESDRGEDEESETSSHTLGRSEDSDSGDDGGDEDSDEELGESDDEGDLFGKSYREGSRK